MLDIQPGLHVVLSETNGASVTRHVHSLRGIHAHKDAANNWEWPLQDGLGSVREVVDNTAAVLESRNYDPFGTGFGNTGTSQTNYGFTGELVDGGGLLDLRARRYAPGLGVFASLDPLETPNRYAYVSGNPVNFTDPAGLQGCAAFDLEGNCILEIQILPTTQPDTEYHMADKRKEYCRRKENQDLQECRDYWDEQEPSKVCGCRTNYHPNSFQPFASEQDMLCNLRCYSGDIPYLFYNIGLRALGTGFQLIPRTFTSTMGTFFEPYEDSTAAYSQFGYRINTANPGGTLVVVQPFVSPPFIRNRAAQLATLVEEIGHASVFHEFFSPPLPECKQITKYQNEFAAKLFKYIWMGLAQNDDPSILFFGGVDVPAFTEPDKPQFIRCNQTTVKKAIQSMVSLGCLDGLIWQHLKTFRV